MELAIKSIQSAFSTEHFIFSTCHTHTMASSLSAPSLTTAISNQNATKIQTSAIQRKPTFLEMVNHSLNCISIVGVFKVHFFLIMA